MNYQVNKIKYHLDKIDYHLSRLGHKSFIEEITNIIVSEMDECYDINYESDEERKNFIGYIAKETKNKLK